VERWLETCGDLAALTHSHPMMDAVIDEQQGRMIRIGDHWLADFASCNYLGLDLDREIIDAVPAYLDAWGTHPSWSRLLGSPVLYEQIEERLIELLGCEDALVMATITHIHMSVISLLAGNGTIFLDARAHKTIYDGCQVSKSRGATVKRFRFEDPDHLDSLPHESGANTKLVCIDRGDQASSSSTAASTSRWPRSRSSPGRRSGSARSSRRPTRRPRSTH
jgi:8-amino-7-oxononanoate synthase